VSILAEAPRRGVRAGRGTGAADEPLALDEAPGHLLRRCHQRSREIFDALIGHEGLSRQQFAVLIAMARNPKASLTAISEASGFDRNTLAEMIVRLVKKGYVTRRRSDADGRAFEIALAPKGVRFVAAMMPRAHEVQRRILEPLPAELRPVFVHCLRVLLGLDALAPAQGDAGRARSLARTDSEHLRRLEGSLWRRETRFDRDYMERTLAPDFFEFGRSGRIYTREDIIGMRPRMAEVKYALKDFKLTPLDHEVVLVTYVSEVRAQELERGNRSSLWRKTPAGWQLSFHQGTAVPRTGTVSD
jgi:DNA-binding MarR family transcriptional regulator